MPGTAGFAASGSGRSDRFRSPISRDPVPSGETLRFGWRVCPGSCRWALFPVVDIPVPGEATIRMVAFSPDRVRHDAQSPDNDLLNRLHARQMLLITPKTVDNPVENMLITRMNTSQSC